MIAGFVQILLPIALFLQGVQGVEDGPPPLADPAADAADVTWDLGAWPAQPLTEASVTQGPARVLMRPFRPTTWDQIRIEQRLTIRIAPRAAQQRDMLAAIPDPPMVRRYVERRSVKCLPAGGIAGVQIGGNDRLVLFMRDQRLIGANLEKACSARDFYSGFYLEPTSDGQLCAGRDVLHSRSGMNCSVSHLHLLEPAD